MPIFALRKWDLGPWDWESQIQNWEWETCLEITQNMWLMFSNTPKLIERLKKYFRYRNSRKRNQYATLTTISMSRNVFYFLFLQACYLVERWLRPTTERAQIIMKQLKKEEAVIKRTITTVKTAINKTSKG